MTTEQKHLEMLIRQINDLNSGKGRYSHKPSEFQENRTKRKQREKLKAILERRLIAKKGA